MNIVVATAFPGLLSSVFAETGDWVYFTDARQPALTAEFIETHQVELLICFGYTRILPVEVLQRVRAINLHGSLLPWNRGPNPNIWSWLDDTLKGVTIHEMTQGVDAGPVIVSRELQLEADSETLNTSFSKLLMSLSQLFAENWGNIRKGDYEPASQTGEGSLYTYADQAPFADLIKEGLDWPIPQLVSAINAVRKT